MAQLMTHAGPAEIGHNSGEIDPITENLKERNAALLQEVEDLLDEAVLATAEIKTEEQAEAVTDLAKKLKDLHTKADNTHGIEKKPYLDGGRSVDDFFRKPLADLVNAAKAAKVKIGEFMAAKEAAKQAALREQAEQLRKEQEAQQAKAAEAAKAGNTEAAEVATIQAKNAETKAARADAQADAPKVATKGALGGASLRKTWVGKIVDRDKLDLNALRPYLADADLQKALNAFVKAGRRELAGATIAEETTAVVR